MKLSQMSIEDIKTQMDKHTKKSVENCTWLHKNKRYVALLNEYSRRLGFNFK